MDVWPLLRGEAGAKGRTRRSTTTPATSCTRSASGDWKLHLPHEYLTRGRRAGRGRQAGELRQHEAGVDRAVRASGASPAGTATAVETQPLALYNLEDDPGETTDVAAKHPEVVQRLAALAERARADLGDSLTKRSGKNVRPGGGD